MADPILQPPAAGAPANNNAINGAAPSPPESVHTDDEPDLTPDTSLKERAIKAVIVTLKIIASPFVWIMGAAAGLIGGILMGLYHWGTSLCEQIADLPRHGNKLCIPCCIVIGLGCNLVVLVINTIVGSITGAGLGSGLSPYHMWKNDGWYNWYKDWFVRTNAILLSISANCGG